MKWTRLRSASLTTSFVTLAILGWLYFAPTQIGGSTSYVITSGTSMEPLFHGGDLALVRPSDQYHVGEVVAYRSTLLHIVVLHRIIGRAGRDYVFKGDNNNFNDPTHPTRAELLGKLWLRVPRGGRVLVWLHTPLVAAAVAALCAALLLFGTGQQHRRRKRRRNGASRSGHSGAARMNSRDHGVTRFNPQTLVAASAVALAVFLGLALIAFNLPAAKSATVRVPYTQQVQIGYSAGAPPGPVYPTGAVNTGDPIFLQLVRRVRVRMNYRLTTPAPHRLAGTAQVVLKLAGPSGWNRSIVVAPPQRFVGDRAGMHVTLDLPRLLALLARIGTLTGVPATGGYTIAVQPSVHISGTVAGHPIDTRFNRGVAFQIGTVQLTPTGGSPTSGASGSGFNPSQSGSVAAAATTAATLGVGGLALSIAALRWIALIGLLLATPVAALTFRHRHSRPFGQAARINAKYGHLIVPITATADALSWAPYEVADIKALVRLAEAGDRLILHHRDADGDTYLVNDESTLYRYRIEATKVAWDEWLPAEAMAAQADALNDALGNTTPTEA